MAYENRKKAIVLLQDGTVFYGRSTGLDGTATGEICFNTGMTGYQEIFTDPSYFGQLMVATTAHIGNYGVHLDEEESGSVKIAGLITKNFSDYQTRPFSKGNPCRIFQGTEQSSYNGCGYKGIGTSYPKSGGHECGHFN